MKQLINEINALAFDLEISKLIGDEYDAWCITNMIEARTEHLRDMMAGRC